MFSLQNKSGGKIPKFVSKQVKGGEYLKKELQVL